MFYDISAGAIRKAIRFTILIFPILLVSCSTLKIWEAKSLKEGIPHFEGSIASICTPIELEYHPTHIAFKLLTVEMAELHERDICDLFFLGRPIERIACETHVKEYGDKIEKVRQERNVVGKIDILGIGKDLVWNIESLEMSIDGRQYKPNVPINRVRVLSDCYGRAREVKISFPTLEKEGNKSIPRPGTGAYSKVVKLFKQSLFPLPDKPIVTGDVLYSFSLSEMVAEMLAFWGEQHEHEILDHFESCEKNMDYIVKGWSYANNRKVLIVDLHFIGSIRVGGKEMMVTNVGFVLFDAKSGHVVKREHLSHMEYGESQFKIWHKNESSIHNGG